MSDSNPELLLIERLKTLAPVHLLLVDDEASVLLVMMVHLLEIDFTAETAADGQLALEKLNERPFDLIVSDVRMPVMDGLTLVRTIREQESATDNHVPVVSMSTMAEPEECLAAGADDFLSKPLKAVNVFECLDRVLTKYPPR